MVTLGHDEGSWQLVNCRVDRHPDHPGFTPVLVVKSTPSNVGLCKGLDRGVLCGVPLTGDSKGHCDGLGQHSPEEQLELDRCRVHSAAHSDWLEPHQPIQPLSGAKWS